MKNKNNSKISTNSNNTNKKNATLKTGTVEKKKVTKAKKRNRNLKRARYRYFYGKFFYPFFCIFIGMVTVAVGIGFDGINGRIFETYFLIPILGYGFLAFIIPFFILKFFYAVEHEIVIQSTIISGISITVLCAGIYLVLEENRSLGLLALGMILILLIIGVELGLYYKTGKIIIYPNRLVMGPYEFYWKDLKLVKIMNREVDLNSLEIEAGKVVEILSPITHRFETPDFAIYFFYIWVETDDRVYIAQPVSHRNQFVQNMRNAFYENWRWDGSEEPPEGWEMPDYRSKGYL